MVGPDGVLPLPWLGEWLTSALRTQRGHAVLVHGPQGVGQWQLSTSLAQAWLCEAAPAAPRPCGTCASCRLVQAHSHPDLLVLLPEALQGPLGWSNGDSEADASDPGSGTKGRQPSKEIKVDAVRSAVNFAQTTPARGVCKVVVLHPAERMNGIAANALLKTLEEPAGAARFVLSSAAPDSLLPTIRSRCQALALALPDRAMATAWLAGQGVAQPEVVLAAAGGQPLDALEWVREGLDARLWSGLPGQVQRGDATAFSGWALPRVVDALQKLCHDALSVAVGAAPRFFPAAALSLRRPRTEALSDWSRLLSRAARQAEHPLNAGLMVESLVSQGRQALTGEGGKRPGSPAHSVHLDA